MPRLLLPKPEPAGTLSKFGYELSKKQQSRHSSLKRASKKYGTLQVLKRVNLIRNLTTPALTSNKKKLSSDVKFMKKIYAKEKKGTKKTSRKNSKRKTRK